MTQMVMIFAPDGEPFEVPAYKVGDLVLNEGWSQTKPEDAPPEEEPVFVPQRGRGKQTVFIEEPAEPDDDEEEEADGDQEDEA